jgi:hypothetical protein
MYADTTLIDSSISDTQIIETFSDSINIGEKGKSKIEIIKHRVFDDTYVIVKFYTRGPNNWFIKNTYQYECNALMDLNPDISDYNNDKFNDITFISATAARGSNEVRRLFVYDERNYELLSIVNSQDYPNMEYNEELNCIDAWLVHGGSSTVFTRIKGDSLKEFASVHNDNHRTIYIVDKEGNRKLLQRKKISEDDVYIRYKNYNPPMPNKE